MTNFKYSLVLGCEYVQNDPNEEEQIDPERMLMNFRSKFASLMKFDDLAQTLAPSILGMESNAEQFTANGSNWMLQDILYFDVEIGQCYPFGGSCSMHTVNIQRAVNEVLQVEKDASFEKDQFGGLTDGRCFFHAIASYFNPESKSFADLEAYISRNINVTIPWPVQVRHIKKFELDNLHLNCAINVIYKNEKGQVFPVYMSVRESVCLNTINLFLFHVSASGEVRTYEDTNIEMSDSDDDIEEEEEEENELGRKNKIAKFREMHYALIHDLNKVITRNRINEMSKQADEAVEKKMHKISKLKKKMNNEEGSDDEYDIKRSEQECENLVKDLKEEMKQIENDIREKKKHYHYGRVNICYNCFTAYSRKETLEKHKKWCFKENPFIPLVAAKGEKDEFELKMKHVKRPITFYVDFEAMQVKPKNELAETSYRSTRICYEQHAFAYCIVVVNNTGQVKDVIDYVGEDAPNQFLNDILDLEQKYQIYLQYKVPMLLTEEEEAHFQATNICHICEKDILPHHKKVRDHNHDSGKYISPAHSLCNLRRKESENYIPIFAHNMKSYDMHFIINALENCMTRIHRLGGIPANSEKFKELTINSMRLKDSLSFLDGTLDSLVQTLIASNHNFSYLQQVFTCEKKRALVMRKGIYPYQFINSIECLLQQTVLPDRDHFYSSLSDKTVDEDEYAHAQEVWKEFDCQNLADYTRLYCVSDTILLCEVMQRFRKSVHEKHSLDPANYISLPGLAKDIMLKTSKVRLDYMSDIDMIYAIKHSIRGGLSYAATRYASVDELEKKTGKKHCILYVDANSL